MPEIEKRPGRIIRRAEAGFTLIELLVVLVILGLLAALAGPRVIGYLGGAKSDTARLQVENFKSALDLYRLDTGTYPTTQQGLGALVRNPGSVAGWKGPYIDSPNLPVDPWGNPYQYLAIDISPAPNRGSVRKDKNLNPLNSDFDLYSMGKDGESVEPLTAKKSHDDVIRANDGSFVGLAVEF